MMNVLVFAGLLVLPPRIVSLVMRIPRSEPRRVKAGGINIGSEPVTVGAVANHFRAPQRACEYADQARAGRI
jgi:hypothetical protein